MSDSVKLQSALQVLTSYFAVQASTTADAAVQLALNVDLIEAFQIQVKNLGGTTDENLKLCTLSDLQELKLDIPLLVLKRIAAIFQGDDGTKALCGEGAQPSGYVSERKADQMSHGELLGRYTPDDDNAVCRKLRNLAKGAPFIVYDDNGTVNVAVSAKLLSELRKGFPPRPHYSEGGKIRKLYCAGEQVDTTADENPIYRGRPLRPDGTCDQTGRSWDGISQEVRQLVAVINQHGGITIDQAHTLMDLATTVPSEEAFTRLSNRHPGSRLAYDEAKKLGKLPILRVELGTNYRSAKNPFKVEA